MTAIAIVLILLLLLGILGAVIKGLLWLTVIAIVLFVGAGVYGWFKFKRRSS
ncbi:MAG: hypothetical protein ABJH68_05770 [Ilumatobacter sp.]|uniref:hypothetical protein n=1 Tax=Ilumatobacter sp. TaxID=1967498 RepID=UPI00329745E3